MAAPRDYTDSLQEIIARHPDWCKTATVPSPSGEGTDVRLIYVRAASSVVCYDPSSRQTTFLPLDSDIVKNASWVSAGDAALKPGVSEIVTTPHPPPSQ